MLVDEADTPIAVEEKMCAHRLGLLHRAFSVFLQYSRPVAAPATCARQYHTRRLWSNTCCGHPQPNESVRSAAERRQTEERGFQTRLRIEGAFRCRAPVTAELVEHEYDHLLVGESTAIQHLIRQRWKTGAGWDLRELRLEMQRMPDTFTCWFAPTLEALRERGALPDRSCARCDLLRTTV